MKNDTKSETSKAEQNLVETIARLGKSLSPPDAAAEAETEKLVGLLLASVGKEIFCHQGKVVAIGAADGIPENTVRIEFREGNKTFSRLFPGKRVGTIKALFLGAEVEYIKYGLGAICASTLRYTGPSAAELLKRKPAQLSKADIRTLEDGIGG